MDWSKIFFQMPALAFCTKDLQELCEPFDLEKAMRQVQVLPAWVKKPVEPKSKNWAEALQLFSQY